MVAPVAVVLLPVALTSSWSWCPSALPRSAVATQRIVRPRCDAASEGADVRAGEVRELLRRRQTLDARTDLSADEIAVRRLCDAVATLEPQQLPAAPSPELSPHDVVLACMCALQENDAPELVLERGVDWGRRYNWGFFGSMVRANWGGDVSTFVREARNNPTGMANCDWFDTEEESITTIAATQTRGAIVKMLVAVRCRDGIPMPARTFLWALQQERRPPQAGCWLVASVLAVDKAYEQLTM
jgi:hypothetical protein